MRGDLYTRAENLQKGTAAGENSLTAAFPCRVKRFFSGSWRFVDAFHHDCARYVLGRAGARAWGIGFDVLTSRGLTSGLTRLF